MSKELVTYEVEINRRNTEVLFERNFRAWIEVSIDGKHCSELTGSVYSYTLGGIKRKAIRKILETELLTSKGVTFGIVFKADGAATDVIEALNSGTKP